MKKQLLYLLILGFAAFSTVVGCSADDDGPTSINPDSIVRFLEGDTEMIVSEGSNEVIEIPVFANKAHEGPVQVFFEIEGDAANYEMISDAGVSVIPTNERTGYILLKPVDNNTYQEVNNSIIIRITGGDSGYGPPDGVSVGHAEKRIIFKDDECVPGDRLNWVGDLSCTDVGYGTYPVSAVVSNSDCDVLIISGNLPNSSSGLEPPFEFLFTGGGGTGTVTCDTQAYGSNTYEATGTYDVSSGEIVADYKYKNSSGGVIWTGTNVIVKN